MTLLEELHNSLAGQKTVMTIGNFDGQHIGHRSIFKTIKKAAEESGRKSLVLSFRPHPVYALGKNPDYRLITSYDERKENILSFGVDYFFEYNFTAEFAKTEPADFLRLLADVFHCAELYIGEDYRFGRERTGQMRDYVEYAAGLGINVKFLPIVNFNDLRISSTAIRELIRDKDFDKASAFLGRPFSITGHVATGMRIGRRLGFPTANIESPPEKLLPPDGVYQTNAFVAGNKYKSLTNIGSNPTFNAIRRTVESHILGFNQDITGETVKIEFVRFIRGEKKFPNAEALINQIKEDMKFVNG